MIVITAISATAITPSSGITFYNFEENTGTTLIDQWGSFDGTINGMTWLNTYPIFNISGNGSNYSGNFDGTDYVTLPDSLANKLVNDYSISTWVNTDSVSGLQHIFTQQEVFRIFLRFDDNKIEYYHFDSSGSVLVESTSTFSINTWIYITTTRNTTSNLCKLYINGLEETSVSCIGNEAIADPYDVVMGARGAATPDRYFDGQIDEFTIYNKTLTPTEIKNKYNYGTITKPLVPVGGITFISQDPADITSTNLLQCRAGLNITYNTSIANLENIYLNYTVNRSTAGCLVSLNGTCIVTNNLYRSVNYSTNRTPNFDWLLDGDNEVYPGVFNSVYTHYNTTSMLNHTISLKKNAIFSELYTVNNETTYSFYEVGANLSDSAMEVYAFNTSYDQSSNFRISPNVVKISEIPLGTAPNHCHDSANCHYVVSFPIINGTVNGLKLSGTVGFILTKPTNPGNLIIEYINEPVRTDTTRTTTNRGATWTSQSWSLNNHLHQFDGTDKMTMQACAVNSTNTTCSAFRSDTFEPGDFPPTSPQVITPTENNYTGQEINITWNPSTSASGTINNYIIQLLNSDLTLNQTINGSVTNTSTYYDWDYFADNISVGTYYIKVIANDSNGVNNTDTSELFGILYDKRLNITAYYYGTTTAVNNFSVQITGVRSENGSTTTGTYSFYGLEGNYSVLIDAEGYSYQTTDTTLDTRYDTLNISLYRTNTINLSFYDSATQVILSGLNITFNLIRDELYSTNNWTTTGSTVLELLAPGSYEIRYNADGYAEGNYFFTLADRSYNDISLYMINGSGATNVTSILYDENGNTLSNYIIKYLQYYPETSSYIEVASKRTNDEGVAVMGLVLNDPYYKVRILNTENVLVKTTATTQLYESTVIYYVTLGDSTINLLSGINGITSTLSHTGTQFRYEFDQEQNTDVTATLKLYKQKIEGNELVSTTTVTSGSGILYLNTTEINGTTYLAQAFIQYSGENEYLDRTLTKEYGENPKPFGLGGVFLVILLIIGMVGIFARQPFAILLIVPLILTLATFLSLIVINKIIIVSLWGVSAIILYIIRDKA